MIGGSLPALEEMAGMELNPIIASPAVNGVIEINAYGARRHPMAGVLLAHVGTTKLDAGGARCLLKVKIGGYPESDYEVVMRSSRGDLVLTAPSNSNEPTLLIQLIQ
jgi:hypothetical protein